jgi:hypothetical protein
MILKCQESSFATGLAGQNSAGEPTGHSAGKGTDRTTAKQLAKKCVHISHSFIWSLFFLSVRWCWLQASAPNSKDIGESASLPYYTF